MALFRAGNEEAFRVIHDRYRQRLFAYTRQMLPGSRQDAEDALQDVFVRAYSNLRSNDRELALRAWLYRVAHNRCIDELRRPASPAPELMEMVRAPSNDPIAEAEQRESLRRLIADVRRLPEQQRSALLMRELSGMSYSELADALGVSVPAVKSLLVRARVSLAQAQEARDTACTEIRDELILAHDRRIRPNAMARRHLRDCAGCREFRTEIRSVSRQFAALVPALGPAAVVANLLGIGGGASGSAAAGGGAAAGSGAAAAGTGALAASGALATGASHVATLLAAAVITAGGAAAIQNTATSSRHHAHHHARPPAKVKVHRAIAAPRVPSTTEESAPTYTNAAPAAQAPAPAPARAPSTPAGHSRTPAPPPTPAASDTTSPPSTGGSSPTGASTPIDGSTGTAGTDPTSSTPTDGTVTQGTTSSTGTSSSTTSGNPGAAGSSGGLINGTLTTVQNVTTPPPSDGSTAGTQGTGTSSGSGQSSGTGTGSSGTGSSGSGDGGH